MLKKVLFLLGLSLSARPGVAQTSSTSPRFYLEAGASVLTQRPFTTYESTLGGPQFTAGAWLTSRLAPQVGVSVIWAGNNLSYNAHPVPPVGTVSSKNTVYTVPLLLRAACIPRDKKVAIDGLVGYTLLYSRAVHTLLTDAKVVGASNRNYATLGLSFGYALTPCLGITATPMLNLDLGKEQYLQENFQRRLLWNLQAGLRYSFG